MPTVGDIYAFLREIAPVCFADEGDNIGLLVGSSSYPINGVICALDITAGVVDEAIEKKTNLIVSHHPVIYKPLYRVTEDTCPIVVRMMRHGISAICMHTNLDRARGGVNDELARRLGLKNIRTIDDSDGPAPLLRVGDIDEESARDFALRVKNALGARSIRCTEGNQPIRRVCVGGGSCGDYLFDAISSADAFVTADVKYHTFTAAAQAGFTLIDAGHFATENVIVAPLAARIQGHFADITADISQKHSDPVLCI